MTTSSPNLPTDAEFHQRKEAFYAQLDERDMAPLWEVIGKMAPVAPQREMAAHIWHYREVRPYLMEAGDLLTAEQAERRVLVLENPALRGKGRATSTMYAGIQLVMPNETAPAHRHVASALRFVLESSGGYSSVAGERSTMARGDFVITPSMTWHDHGNHSDGPLVWVDMLDVHIVNFFDASFFEHHNTSEQILSKPEGDALARYGNAMLPIDGDSPFGKTTPVFNYPFARTREALLAVARAGLDPHFGATLRYANPIDGGWPMPTIASWMTYLPAGTKTKPVRSTDALMVAVPFGKGTVVVDERRIPFEEQDVFVTPNWTWRSFEAEDDTFLFCTSDRVVQEKLGFWREERQ